MNTRDEFVRSAKLEKLIDGDTLRVRIDLGWGADLIHDVRLAGVNTPENRGPEREAGLYVTNQVGMYLAGNPQLTIRSRDFKLGKFGRCVCDVYVRDNHSSLNVWLIESGYAWTTDDGGSLMVPRELSLLTGLPEELRT